MSTIAVNELLQSPEMQAVLTRLVQQAVSEAQKLPRVTLIPGTFEGTDENGDGIVRLDSDDPNQDVPIYAQVIGPHPVYGARVVMAFIPPMTCYVLGEVTIPKPGSELQARVLLDTPTGEVQSYDDTGALVGRISPTMWHVGDEVGSRTQIDPFGGLRIFDTDNHLTVVTDSEGVQVRDPVTGIVHGHLGHNGLTLRALNGNMMELVPDQPGEVSPPKWAGSFVTLPLDTHTTPALVQFTTGDLELRHFVAFTNAVLGAESSTPPASHTEILDAADVTSGCSMLVSIASRSPAVPNAVRTFTSTDTGWQFDNGHTVVLKGDGITAPSVRATSSVYSIHNTAVLTIGLGPPASIVAGDVMVAFVSMGNDGGSVPSAWSVPEGWQFLGAGFQTAGANITQSTLASGVWYKIATAADVALAAASGIYEVTINVVGSPTSTKKMHAAIVTVQDVAIINGGSDIRFDPASRARAYSDVDTNLVVATDVPVNWNKISHDPGNAFDLPANTYVIPHSGPYSIGWRVITEVSAAGERFITFLRKNGTQVSVGTDIISAGTRAALSGADNLNLAAGDTLDVVVRQVNGTARKVDGSLGGETACFFHVQRALST